MKQLNNERERLILLLVKQDFPDMDLSKLANISPHQRRGYLSSVTRFLKLADLLSYNQIERYEAISR